MIVTPDLAIPEGLVYLRSMLGKRPSQLAQSEVIGAAYLYLFKGQRVELEAAVARHKQPTQDFRLRQFQKLTRYDGTLLRDTKAWAYEQVNGVTATTYRINTPSKRVIRQALTFPKLAQHLNGYAARGFRPLTSRAYDRAIANALQSADLSSYMAKFVARKMSFITSSAGIPPAEVISDLRESAMYALLRAYPAWSDMGHLLAIAKTAVHNRGINFIMEHTTQSRAHLQQSSTGEYSAVNVSLSQFTDAASANTTVNASSDDAHLVSTLDGSKASDQPFSRDTLNSLQQIAASRQLKPKQREYLKLLVGTDDPLFTLYLGEPNSDVAHRLPFPSYHKKVCEFLDLDETRGYAFLLTLKTYL